MRVKNKTGVPLAIYSPNFPATGDKKEITNSMMTPTLTKGAQILGLMNMNSNRDFTEVTRKRTKAKKYLTRTPKTFMQVNTFDRHTLSMQTGAVGANLQE